MRCWDKIIKFALKSILYDTFSSRTSLHWSHISCEQMHYYIYRLLINPNRILSSWTYFHHIQPFVSTIPPTCIPLNPPYHHTWRILDTPNEFLISRASIWYQTRYVLINKNKFWNFRFWVGVWGDRWRRTFEAVTQAQRQDVIIIK